MSKITGIKCIGQVFDTSGYAEWCRKYILCLIDSGIPVTIGTDLVKGTGRPITFDDERPNLGKRGELLEEHVGKEIDYNVVMSWLTPDWSLEQTADEDKARRIFMSLWEADRLHDYWAICCGKADEVWVPGKFNKEVFSSSFKRCSEKYVNYKGLKNIPIRTSRCPIDFDDYKTNTNIILHHPSTSEPLDKDTYVFYYISQWTERKNFRGLLEAYWSEFSAEDNVVLYLKTYGSDHSTKNQDLIYGMIANFARVCNKPNIPATGIIKQLLSRDQMLALHKRGDCYVSPSRGEGLGLGMLEAGLFGNPIISHLFGEQASYLNEDRGLIYDYTLRPVNKMGDNWWYILDQSWADPDVKGMAKQMRFAFENRKEARAKGQQLNDYLLENYSYESTIREIKEHLEDSLSKKPVEGYSVKQ